jgi:predicted RNA polymerase sigma factor
VAKNLALDLIRRDKVFRKKENEIAHLMEQVSAGSNAAVAESGENGITDDRLRMMFTCCHPLIPQEMQVALALKTLCGFSPAEIARAFLTSEAAIAKRLTRAKQRIRETRIAFENPGRRGIDPTLGRRAAIALPAFQRRLQGFRRGALDPRRTLS